MPDMLPIAAPFNGMMPLKDGKEFERPLSMEKRFDFSAAAQYNFDLVKETEGALIQFVQTVYIDNSDNPAAVTLIVSGSNQRLVARARSQGFYPLLAPNPPHFSVSSTEGEDRETRMIFLNVPMPASTW